MQEISKGPKMTVDLSKAQKGSKVMLRCGSEMDIRNIRPSECEYMDYTVTYWEAESIDYYQNGKRLPPVMGEPQYSPFDIIEIIPPEFDWSTVKWGQAFKDEDGVWIYIGPSKDKGELIFEHTLGDFGPTCVRLSYAQEYKTRVPKHDITEEVE